MNGINIGSFDLSSPQDTRSAGLGDDDIRSVKSTLQQAIDDEHVFSSAGGIVGAHRLGSARPYYGTQSRVSSSGTDGRIMVTSDTSRLFGVGSGGSVLLGGPTAIYASEFPGVVPQRHYWTEEFGVAVTGSSGSVSVTIPNSGFSGLPYIFLTRRMETVADTLVYIAYTQVDATTFIVTTAQGGVFASNQTFVWRSLGTRTL